MAQNIFAAIFDIESEGFQAFSELKQNPGNQKSLLSQVALVKKENGATRILDAFDTGVATTNDTEIGGVVGAFLGILGGPIGVILGSSYGALIGSALDAGDAIDQASLLEQIAEKMQDDDVVLIGLAAEEDESILDGKLSKFKVTILRYDAVAVAEEVAEAEAVEEEVTRQALISLRKEKDAKIKAEAEARRAELLKQIEDSYKYAQAHNMGV